MDFVNDILCIDYDKVIQKMCDYGTQNEKYCNAAPALDAILRHRNHKDIDLYELENSVNKVLTESEARRHFDIDKNLNIANEMKPLDDDTSSFCELYSDGDGFTLEARPDMKSINGKVEAFIRSGVYFEHELTPDDFEDVSKIDKTYLDLGFVLLPDKAFVWAEVRNGYGRSIGKFNLTDEEVKSLHEKIIEKTHEDDRFAYHMGRAYLLSMDKYPEYELVEDNYEYDKGLMIIYYTDKSHEEEIEHVCIDLDHLENHLPIGFPCTKYSFEKEHAKDKQNTEIDR